MTKILFILKKGASYSGFDRKFSGLYNSTKFVSDAIDKTVAFSKGRFCVVDSKVVQVHDNNCIDREVHRFKPDIVVIEALWVVPEKFDVLKKLHPKVRWYVHLHSDVAFLSNEGVAFDWVPKYLLNGVGIISNSKELIKALRSTVAQHFGEIVYLPNCYPAAFKKRKDRSEILDIGCFGAIRPLKNQMIQAMAAIKYANDHKKFLRFHVNENRVEGGAQIQKNMRALFEQTPHQLVEHVWVNHHEFVSLMRRMDALMQVSFSETFNIVSADAIANGVPVVGSSEIEWLACQSKAHTNKLDDIVLTLSRALKSRALLLLNQIRLWSFARRAKKKWLAFVFGKAGV